MARRGSRGRSARDRYERSHGPVRGSTFHVASVKDEVSGDLAGVVHSRRVPLGTRRLSRPEPGYVLSAPVRVSESERGRGERVLGVPENVDPLLEVPLGEELHVKAELRPDCKKRPDGRRKGGRGAGRPFVPWCK